MSRSKIGLLLVDDHMVVRLGLRSLLEIQPDMDVVAEAAGGNDALDQYSQFQPDVVLMDLRMPGMGGVETTIAIREKFPEARIIVLTTFDQDEDIYRALQAGAAAFLVKTIDSAPLLETIRAVFAGKYKLPPDVATRLAQRKSAPRLSPREHQVLVHLTQGRSNKEIAAELGLATDTVKIHVKVIFEKLDVHDRTQAATKAIKLGIVKI